MRRVIPRISARATILPESRAESKFSVGARGGAHGRLLAHGVSLSGDEAPELQKIPSDGRM